MVCTKEGNNALPSLLVSVAECFAKNFDTVLHGAINWILIALAEE